MFYCPPSPLAGKKWVVFKKKSRTLVIHFFEHRGWLVLFDWMLGQNKPPALSSLNVSDAIFQSPSNHNLYQFCNVCAAAGRLACGDGRNELETLMASTQAADWVKLSELVMGKAPGQGASLILGSCCSLI